MIERFAKIVAGLRRSLFFNKVAGLRPATLSQKRDGKEGREGWDNNYLCAKAPQRSSPDLLRKPIDGKCANRSPKNPCNKVIPESISKDSV